MITLMPWRLALIAAAILLTATPLQAEEKVVAYVPNWVNLDAFTKTIDYVEYRTDGSYITTSRKSFACAECHVKAGSDRDFVYRGRLPEKQSK